MDISAERWLGTRRRSIMFVLITASVLLILLPTLIGAESLRGNAVSIPAQGSTPVPDGLALPNRSLSWHLAAVGGPPMRTAESMANDPKDGYVVMTGGWGPAGGLVSWYNDTWGFSAGRWTNLTTAVRPAPTLYASMTYDRADGYVLLFGGCIGSLGCPGGTWTFTGGNWTHRTPAVSPPPSLMGGAMVYDADDGYVLLFGGAASMPIPGGSGSYLTNATWKYAAGVWTNITSSVGPSPRYGAQMTYDWADGYVLLQGGGTRGSCVGTCPVADTWSFAAGTWTRLTPTTSPPARYMGGMVYDEHLGYVVLYGGMWSSWPAPSDTWSYSHGNWTQLAPLRSPSAQYYLSVAYNSDGGAVAVYETASLGHHSFSTMWLLF